MIITENKNSAAQKNKIKSKSDNIIKICYASDQNYAKYLALSMATVLMSKATDDNIKFYILDGGLTEKDRANILYLKKTAVCEINFITVSQETFRNCTLGEAKHISTAAYYRLLLPDILPDINKIIYLDCDVRVKGSLKELFNTNLEENYVGAVQDSVVPQMSQYWNLNEYYNSGVLLLDLNKLRKIKFTQNLTNYINQYDSKLLYPDQDIINLYFKHQIKPLDQKWNTLVFYHSDELKNQFKNTGICHYIARDKAGFVYDSMAAIFKTKYKAELLKLIIKRIPKMVMHWIFMLRRRDENTKILTIFGFKLNIKSKAKEKNKEEFDSLCDLLIF